jgi:hypothetical protein|tara:strand:+ start:320 stop:589 length:270 start_codon:yes stop_codon:yes gene_type:complete
MLKKISYSLILIFIFTFFYFVISHYYSDINIKIINSNRSNFEETLKIKTSNLHILKNDTNNVIEFNSGFNIKEKNEVKRSFWELFDKDE